MTDVSRNVVAILLVLVVAVSGLGTWTVLSANRDQHVSSGSHIGPSTGHVNVAIENPPRADTSVRLTVAEAPTNG